MKYRLKIALHTCSPNPIQILHKLHTQYCHWISNYQRGRVWILLTKFNPITVLYLSQARIKCHMSWSYFIFNDLRCKVIVCFVDIGWIVDHDCLNFLFIKSFKNVCCLLQHTVVIGCQVNFWKDWVRTMYQWINGAFRQIASFNKNVYILQDNIRFITCTMKNYLEANRKVISLIIYTVRDKYILLYFMQISYIIHSFHWTSGIC